MRTMIEQDQTFQPFNERLQDSYDDTPSEADHRGRWWSAGESR